MIAEIAALRSYLIFKCLSLISRAVPIQLAGKVSSIQSGYTQIFLCQRLPTPRAVPAIRHATRRSHKLHQIHAPAPGNFY